MLEILQFYVSSFWVWLGITLGAAIVLKWLVVFAMAIIAAFRGNDVHIGDVVNHRYGTEED
jgi:ABC-type multidrug transport system permease subunit